MCFWRRKCKLRWLTEKRLLREGVGHFVRYFRRTFLYLLWLETVIMNKQAFSISIATYCGFNQNIQYLIFFFFAFHSLLDFTCLLIFFSLFGLGRYVRRAESLWSCTCLVYLSNFVLSWGKGGINFRCFNFTQNRICISKESMYT